MAVVYRALSDLAAFDARKSQIAELRVLGGLSLEETGNVYGVSMATVEPEWQAARSAERPPEPHASP